jgi:hypothetical protein
MSFVVDDGNLIVKDGAETVLHTGTDDLLHYLTPRLDGSFSRSAANWGGSTSWGGRFTDTVIRTGLPSVAPDLVGLVRIQYSGGYTYLPSGSWFVAGGSFLMVAKRFQTISGDWGEKLSSMAAITIYKSGTNLRFREQIALLDHYMAGPNLNLAPFTVTYRLFPAVFS